MLKLIESRKHQLSYQKMNTRQLVMIIHLTRYIPDLLMREDQEKKLKDFFHLGLFFFCGLK